MTTSTWAMRSLEETTLSLYADEAAGTVAETQSRVLAQKGRT